MKKSYLLLVSLLFIAIISFFIVNRFTENEYGEQYKEEENEEYDGPDKAAEWQFNRTKDPVTGQIPAGEMWQAVMQAETAKNQLRASKAAALSWTERGSFTDAPGPQGNTRPPGAVTSGRIDAMLVDAGDPTGKTVWIGGDMGGLWKTTDITANPANWTLINDFFGNLIISSIAQDPTNPDIMYFATGEAYYGGEFGIGAFKSIDHGVTWTQMTNTASYLRIARVLCDAAGNVYLGCNGIAGGAGLLRSTNGGGTWTDITPSTVGNRVCDLEISNTGRMHLCVGIGVNQNYRYTDNPATATSGSGWVAPTTNFTSGTQRVEIGVSGNTLYALPASANQVNTIYKSTDGGDNWVSVGAPPASLGVSTFANGQAWYDLAVAVNPSNPDECVIGAIDNAKTTNGGASWVRISGWFGGAGTNYVHADQHTSIWYDNGNKLILGGDGGIFYSANGGNTASDRNVNLRLKQFYSCAMHPTSTNYFIAGAQDNGNHKLDGPGLTSSVEITGGDGAFVDIDQDEPQFQFGAYVYNQYRRTTNGGTTWSSINFSGSTGQFINPFDYDDLGNRMYCSYIAGQYLRWENPQTGSTFTGVPIPSFNSAAVSNASVSPFTANRVYFGTYSGRVVRVDDAHTATPIDVNITGVSMPSGATVNSIGFGSTEQNMVACMSNYNISNVWVSSNNGTTWTACDGNLPNIPVYSAIFHPDDNNKMIIATEVGVWETDALNGASTVWTPSVNFPTVRTTMLRYRALDRMVLASTYGRGLWTTPIPNGCTNAAISTQPANSAICVANNTTFSITASGVAYQWQLSTDGGTTFNNLANGGVYSGATTATLTVTGATAGMNTYRYRCVVTGDCAPVTSVNSNAAILTVNAATTITTQPSAATICANSNTSLSVAASGTALTYQWQVSTNGGTSFTNVTNVAPYSGATTTTLNITSATAGLNNNQYRCIVGSACSPLNSNAVVLTVNAAPSVTTQPSSTSICAGNTVSFTTAAAGTGLTYQWELSTNGGTTFTVIGGATAATYSFTAALGQNNNQYRCVVGGTCTPAITTNAATLTVGSTLVINSQPGNSTPCVGGNAAFSVAVSGTVTYQWQESTNGGTTYTNINNGGIYAGATTATLSLTGVSAGANNNLYRCVVSGNCPSITSNPGTLTVNTAPAITTQPTATAVICASQNTSFTTAASGTGVTYQWQVSTNGGTSFTNLGNAAPYSGVNAATLNITGAAAALNNNQYRCVVSGTCTPAATTTSSVLTVYTPVSVTANPANSLLCENSNTSFSVTAAGTTPAYQWQVSTNGGTTFTNVSNSALYTGATTATLSLSGITFALNNNQYRCVVTGVAPCGVVNSAAATLSINAAPAPFVLTGGGAYCAGGSGIPVGLGNSAVGFNYQLQLNGVNTGTAVSGTGGSLNFGNRTTAGVYTVVASNTTTGCTVVMPGSVTVVMNPLPIVALAASQYRSLFPGLVTTLTATVTSGTAPYSYVWFKNGGPLSNTASTLPVNVSGLGDYRVTAIDANGCLSQSQLLTIADSANNKLFIYPSPNDGRFSIVHYNTGNVATRRTVNIYNSLGQIVYTNVFTVTLPYQLLPIDLRRQGAGLYYVVMTDAAGKKLKTGEVVVR
jgi:hypothetical protein